MHRRRVLDTAIVHFRADTSVGGPVTAQTIDGAWQRMSAGVKAANGTTRVAGEVATTSRHAATHSEAFGRSTDAFRVSIAA